MFDSISITNNNLNERKRAIMHNTLAEFMEKNKIANPEIGMRRFLQADPLVINALLQSNDPHAPELSENEIKEMLTSFDSLNDLEKEQWYEKSRQFIEEDGNHNYQVKRQSVDTPPHFLATRKYNDVPQPSTQPNELKGSILEQLNNQSKSSGSKGMNKLEDEIARDSTITAGITDIGAAELATDIGAGALGIRAVDKVLDKIRDNMMPSTTNEIEDGAKGDGASRQNNTDNSVVPQQRIGQRRLPLPIDQIDGERHDDGSFHNEEESDWFTKHVKPADTSPQTSVTPSSNNQNITYPSKISESQKTPASLVDDLFGKPQENNQTNITKPSVLPPKEEQNMKTINNQQNNQQSMNDLLNSLFGNTNVIPQQLSSQQQQQENYNFASGRSPPVNVTTPSPLPSFTTQQQAPQQIAPMQSSGGGAIILERTNTVSTQPLPQTPQTQMRQPNNAGGAIILENKQQQINAIPTPMQSNGGGAVIVQQPPLPQSNFIQTNGQQYNMQPANQQQVVDNGATIKHNIVTKNRKLRIPVGR